MVWATQVLGHVQVASPQAPFFPKVPICSPPPPPFKVEVKGFFFFFYTQNVQSRGGQGFG